MCQCVFLKNTGTKPEALLDKVRKIIFTSLLKEDGDYNQIDLAAATSAAYFNEAYFLAKTNNTDEKLKWFPTGRFYETSIVPAEDNFEALSDGSKVKTLDGIISFEGKISENDGASPEMADRIQAQSCQEFLSGYFIDNCDALAGEVIEEDYLAGIKLNPKSLSAKYFPATNTTSAYVLVKFDIHLDSDMAQWAIIKSAEMEYNPSRLEGLFDVYFEVVSGSITATTVKVRAKTEFFTTALINILDKGLVTADFVSTFDAATSKIRNETTDANITVTSVEQTTKGEYVLTFAAQTANDVLEVTAKRNGRVYHEVSFVAV